MCVYVSEKLEASVTDIRLTGAEAMMVRVGCSGRLVTTVLAVYRTPSVGPSAFLDDFAVLLPTLPSNSVVVGDLNFDLNLENTPDNFTLDYLRILSCNGFFNIIQSPTRLGNTKLSLLDHIFINNTEFKVSSCTILTDILADHLPIVGCIHLPKLHGKRSSSITVTKLDHDLLANKINEPENWNEIYASDNPEQAFAFFANTMQKLVAQSSYSKQIKQGKKHTFKQPWMTKKLHKLIKKRDGLLRKIHDQPYNEKLEQKYKKHRNLATESIKIAKREFYQAKFETTSSDPNKKWEFVNTVLNRKNCQDDAPNCLKIDDQKITEKNEIAEKFNEFFTNVGSNLAAQLPVSNIDPLNYISEYSHALSPPPFCFQEISLEITSKILSKSSTKKAVGCDGISMKLLKEHSTAFAPILTHMINLIVKHSIFPDSQKIARVRPLHKKGDKSELNNYRPISILTATSKIIEKVLAAQLRLFLETNNIFCNSQYGFREKRSTTSAISKLMEQLYSNFDESKITQGIFLDFSKAFDTIDHEILMKKLPFYNFTNDACLLLKSYLSNRKQYVKIDHFQSSLSDINIGVPQGSVLGPILFIIFINDLVNAAPMFNYILFADDTNIFSTEPTLLQSNLKHIENWCLANRLILNYTKTFQILFKTPNKIVPNTENYILEMGKNQLVSKPSTKFLGIYLDNAITFKCHISELCQKLNFILLLMRCARPYLDQKTMISLYYAFFYPHLIYGIEFYGHAADCYLNQIYLLQKAALRIILKIHPRGHVTTYFKELRIMPIDMLFKYRFLIHFHKANFNYELNIERAPETCTRSNKLYKPKRATNCRGERSLLTTGVNLWNAYLMGEEATEPSCLPRRLASALWGSYVPKSE